MSLGARLIAGSVMAAALAGSAQAEQVAERTDRQAKPAMSAPAARPTEAITVAVLDGRETVWSGTLRIGGTYGNASFSQSRNEYAEPCPGQVLPDGRQLSSSESLSFSIGRYNWQQEPDRFNISLNWSTAVNPCQGEGNDSFGFNRVVTLPQGQTVTVAGSGSLTVRLTRNQ